MYKVKLSGSTTSAPERVSNAGPRHCVVGGGALLTARERQIADLVASGLTNRAIASHLHLSQRTVESHVAHIFNKLGVRSRVTMTNRINELR